MPPLVFRSISTSGATLTAPVLVCSGRRIGTATARALIERIFSCSDFTGGASLYGRFVGS